MKRESLIWQTHASHLLLVVAFGGALPEIDTSLWSCLQCAVVAKCLIILSWQALIPIVTVFITAIMAQGVQLSLVDQSVLIILRALTLSNSGLQVLINIQLL